MTARRSTPERAEPARPLLLGHRGARRDAPENTLEAFDCALAHGCDGFEFDVRLTRDRRCVICHDASLRGYDIAATSFDSLSAPCLDDVLDRFAGRAFLDIELKVGGGEPEVLELLRRFPPRRGYFLSSFQPPVIEAFYRAGKSLPLGLICDTRRQLAGWTSLPVAALFLERRLASAAVLDALHEAGKQVFVWTVNREREMRQFAALGVEGLISDDTELLAKTLARPG
jgi:glycerophosphoryl diester phosphodiesterase